jgi:hypothetical protein
MSETDRRILKDAPEGSELERWRLEGERLDYSNIISWKSPNQEYLLEITLDDPVAGFLIRLFDMTCSADPRSSEARIAQTVVDKMADDEQVWNQATQMAAASDELRAVDDDPVMGPEYPDLELVERPHSTPNPPEEWESMEDEWNDKMEAAIEKAESVPASPSLTTKEIDGSAYYYLQWRTGGSVVSQYVAPVEP